VEHDRVRRADASRIRSPLSAQALEIKALYISMLTRLM
jgi:hypothetical protein